MNRLLKCMSHPAWGGLGSLSGIASALLAAFAIFLVYNPPVGKEKEKPDESVRPSTTTLVPDNTSTDRIKPVIVLPPDQSVENAQERVNEMLHEQLGSIKPGYHGMHQYFNDAPSVGTLAAVFGVIGVGLFISNRLAKSATH